MSADEMSDTRKRGIWDKAFRSFKHLLPKVPLLKRFLYGVAGYALYHREFRRSLSDRNIFLIGTPEHGNLGDHAIAFATIRYLHRILPDYHVTEISEEMFFKYVYCLKRYSRSSDIIILSGGGNIGNIYRIPEIIRRCVIRAFPKNRILIFPQTVYFTNDRKGWRERRRSFRIYGGHNHLIVTARECYSYEYFSRYLPDGQVLMMPDIVFTLSESDSRAKRSGALLCFRKDGERRLAGEDISFIRHCLKKHYGEIHDLDSDLGVKIGISERVPALKKFWSSFQKAGLVVTDRLHGMIFAAITGTPCIAFSNYNHKLKGSYQWIRHLPYVRYLEDIGQFEDALQQMKKLSLNMEYSNGFALQQFEKLKEVLT